MNIQIRITVHTANYDDTFVAEVIEKIMEFVRALFPEMHPNRMDSPVVVTITRESAPEEETPE